VAGDAALALGSVIMTEDLKAASAAADLRLTQRAQQDAGAALVRARARAAHALPRTQPPPPPPPPFLGRPFCVPPLTARLPLRLLLLGPTRRPSAAGSCSFWRRAARRG